MEIDVNCNKKFNTVKGKFINKIITYCTDKSLSNVKEYIYDDNGLIKFKLIKDFKCNKYHHISQYIYNKDNRLIAEIETLINNDNDIESINISVYQYDNLDNITIINIISFSKNTIAKIVHNMQYKCNTPISATTEYIFDYTSYIKKEFIRAEYYYPANNEEYCNIMKHNHIYATIANKYLDNIKIIDTSYNDIGYHEINLINYNVDGTPAYSYTSTFFNNKKDNCKTIDYIYSASKQTKLPNNCGYLKKFIYDQDLPDITCILLFVLKTAVINMECINFNNAVDYILSLIDNDTAKNIIKSSLETINNKSTAIEKQNAVITLYNNYVNLFCAKEILQEEALKYYYDFETYQSQQDKIIKSFQNTLLKSFHKSEENNKSIDNMITEDKRKTFNKLIDDLYNILTNDDIIKLEKFLLNNDKEKSKQCIKFLLELINCYY